MLQALRSVIAVCSRAVRQCTAVLFLGPGSLSLGPVSLGPVEKPGFPRSRWEEPIASHGDGDPDAARLRSRCCTLRTGMDSHSPQAQ